MSVITMPLFATIQEIFGRGDPLIGTWFLVDGYVWQMLLPLFYVMFVKVWGPALMKNRQPFKLHVLLIVYNFSLVLIYSTCMAICVYYVFRYNMFHFACQHYVVQPNTPVYYVSCFIHVVYLVKYLEFFDTISLVLRKKINNITNLHLIHHAVLPIVGWILLRSEITAYQAIPAFINSCVHVLMYSYYGVAAMGPKFSWLIWWKQYLTLLQMAQFAVIIILAPIMQLAGCKATKHGLVMSLAFAALMLLLFYQFYNRSYQPAAPNQQKIENQSGEKKD